MKDVQELVSKLRPSTLKEHKEFQGLNNLDFVWGTTAFVDLYKKIVNILEIVGDEMLSEENKMYATYHLSGTAPSVDGAQ